VRSKWATENRSLTSSFARKTEGDRKEGLSGCVLSNTLGSTRERGLVVPDSHLLRTGRAAPSETGKRKKLIKTLAGTVRNSSEAIPFGPAARIYSSRNRIIGSSDRVRCAGIQVAASPSDAIARTTPASTRGSRGVA
jgi:hypothetical protein